MTAPAPRSVVTECAKPRCKRLVFEAQVLRGRTPVDVVLDAAPSTWAEGARVKLIPSGHAADGVQLATALTATQVHQAFGVTRLYVPHDERCDDPTGRRKKARKKDDSHA